MDIGTIKVFKAVEEEGSVSRAALKLHCVQSNVTARLRQLEDELDVKLFYRKKRGMALTPSGRLLSGYAGRILALVREAERAVRDNGDIKGPLDIGTLDSTAAARLPGVLSRFRSEFPDVELTIQTGSSLGLIQMVLDYQLDGAFIGMAVENKDIEQERMFDERLVMVSEKPMKAADAVENPTLVVFPEGCTYRKALEDWLQSTGRAPYKIIEMGTIEGILGCIVAGLGIGGFPLSVIENFHYLNRLGIHQMPEEFALASTVFIRRKDAVLTKGMAAFLRIARETG